MNKGDIVLGKKNLDGKHPIVYIGENNDDSFIGAMITSTSYGGKNIIMDVNHFKLQDTEGHPCSIVFNNSHLVPVRLLKRQEWEPFKKCGELTRDGIEFVEEAIGNNEPIFWEEALQLVTD